MDSIVSEGCDSQRKEKVCPKCSITFTCSSVNCWCGELPQIMPMNYEAECLCPNCLKEVIDEKVKAHKAS
jgi:hypothetical protein